MHLLGCKKSGSIAKIVRLALTCTLMASTAPVYSQARLPIDRHEAEDLGAAVSEAIADRGPTIGNRVLLIFDIDNTLLTMPQFLGSDQWFNYHAGLISSGKDASFRTFNDLIAAQTALFSLGTMKPTQEDAGSLIGRAKSNGVDVYLLSARGPELYNVTRRELNRNGIVFQAEPACSYVICSLSGAYSDADIRRAITSFGGKVSSSPYREIVIRDGVMMVAGQDKGNMLRVLLAALAASRYDKIIFVDDTQKNIDSVTSSDIPVALSVYHYTRIPTAVSDQQIAQGDRQWNRIRTTICSVVAVTFCEAKP